MLFGISRSSCYTVLRGTINSILSRFDMSGLPFDDTGKLDAMSRHFPEFRAHLNPLLGFLGAVDGIDIKIAKPRDCFAPRNYICWKGLDSVPF
jgi:hypothetical protein